MNKIGWCDETWNFIGGCSECSPGCVNCWACRQALGRLKNQPLYKGLTEKGHWTGEIRLCTDIGRKDILEQPLHWRYPRRIFVQAMGDLFHEKVPRTFVGKVIDVASQCPQHTFLLLTKRPENAQWPVYYPNVHLGVTVCNQAEADEKIPILLQIPAAHRFLCLEPLLGKVDLDMYLYEYKHSWFGSDGSGSETWPKIDWVIVGCESINGRAGRFKDGYEEAARSIIEQCKAASAKIWHKQMPIGNRVSKNMAEWPVRFRVQELA